MRIPTLPVTVIAQNIPVAQPPAQKVPPQQPTLAPPLPQQVTGTSGPLVQPPVQTVQPQQPLLVPPLPQQVPSTSGPLVQPPLQTVPPQQPTLVPPLPQQVATPNVAVAKPPAQTVLTPLPQPTLVTTGGATLPQALATPATQVISQSALQTQPPATGNPAAMAAGPIYRISAGDLGLLEPLPDRKPPLSTSTLDHTVIGIALPRFVDR